MSETRDRNEVRQLYEIHGRALLAYACAFLHDPTEAEDVLHQVFLQLLRDFGRRFRGSWMRCACHPIKRERPWRA